MSAKNEKTPQEILDGIEDELIAEGLLPSEPVAVKCDGCGEDKLDCSDYEGVVVESGTFCSDCWPDVDRLESLVGETGKAVQRYLRDGHRHFVFLEPGKEPGILLMVTRDTVQEFAYFNPTGIAEDTLLERLRSIRLSLS